MENPQRYQTRRFRVSARIPTELMERYAERARQELKDLRESLDRELILLTNKYEEECLDLSREELLRRFAEKGVEWHVVGARVFVPNWYDALSEALESRDKIIQKNSYGIDTNGNWKSFPKSVMDDPDLALTFSLEPRLFPLRSIYNGSVETTLDFGSGVYVQESGFKLSEWVDIETRRKVVMNAEMPNIIKVPIPECRDETLSVLRLPYEDS